MVTDLAMLPMPPALAQLVDLVLALLVEHVFAVPAVVRASCHLLLLPLEAFDLVVGSFDS